MNTQSNNMKITDFFKSSQLTIEPTNNQMKITDLSIDILHIINQNTKYIRLHVKIRNELSQGFRRIREIYPYGGGRSGHPDESYMGFYNGPYESVPLIVEDLDNGTAKGWCGEYLKDIREENTPTPFIQEIGPHTPRGPPPPLVN